MRVLAAILIFFCAATFSAAPKSEKKKVKLQKPGAAAEAVETPAVEEQAAPGAQEIVQVLKVIDFETIKVTYKQKTMRIKLIGVKILRENEIVTRARYLPPGSVDVDDLLARGAKGVNYLKNKLGRGDQLTIDIDGGKKDAAGRMLVYLFDASQKLINTEIIREGYAYPNRYNLKPGYRKEYDEAFAYAMAEKKGLWELWKGELEFKERNKKPHLVYEAQKKISIMTFNVQNLFDNTHDDRKNDHTFLPLSQKSGDDVKRQCGYLHGKNKRECLSLNWSDAVLKTKLERVAATIQQINNGAGPDILLLQEVENYGILERLNKEFLLPSNYQIIHFESKDRRGIDVAVLTRLKQSELPKYHEIPFKKGFDTRGILECTFYLPNHDELTLFVMHLPAQMAPIVYRQKSMRFVTMLAQRLPKERLVIAGGDTNISSREEKDSEILKKFAEPFWKVSHKIGCKNCKGTFFFGRDQSWSFFDMFFFSGNLVDGPSHWRVNRSSIRLANQLPFQSTGEKTPQPYDPPEFKGVSDHFPLYAEIEKSR